MKELFIDIFPVDKWGEVISIEEQLQESKKIKKISEDFHKNDHYIEDFTSRIIQAKELTSGAEYEKIIKYFIISYKIAIPSPILFIYDS